MLTVRATYSLSFRDGALVDCSRLKVDGWLPLCSYEGFVGMYCFAGEKHMSLLAVRRLPLVQLLLILLSVVICFANSKDWPPKVAALRSRSLLQTSVDAPVDPSQDFWWTATTSSGGAVLRKCCKFPMLNPCGRNACNSYPRAASKAT